MPGVSLQYLKQIGSFFRTCWATSGLQLQPHLDIFEPLLSSPVQDGDPLDRLDFLVVFYVPVAKWIPYILYKNAV